MNEYETHLRNAIWHSVKQWRIARSQGDESHAAYRGVAYGLAFALELLTGANADQTMQEYTRKAYHARSYD